MTNKKTILSAFVVIAMTVLSSCCGCKSSKSKNAYKLDTHSWSAIEVMGAKITPEEDSFTLTVNSEGNEIFGRGDCNRYFGKYESVDGKKITFKNMGSTRMMCQNQTREDNFMTMLNEADSYTIDGDTLLVLSKGETKAIFKAIPKISKEK